MVFKQTLTRTHPKTSLQVHEVTNLINHVFLRVLHGERSFVGELVEHATINSKGRRNNKPTHLTCPFTPAHATSNRCVE